MTPPTPESRPRRAAPLPRRRPAALVLALACAGGVSAGTASALEVVRSRTIAAPPAAVWAVIGGFCDIARWHPEVEGCTLAQAETGPVRSLVAKGGLGTIVERETARDDRRMSYAYALIRGPLPVRDYASTLGVAPNGTGATVTWRATFEAAGMTDAEAVADIAGVYDRGLAGIAQGAEP